jgi:transposase
MNTYPIELRHRVVKAVDNKIGTNKEIAEMFSVSVSWISKLLRRRNQTGSIEPLPRTQGRKPVFTGVDFERLNSFVRDNSDATLEEIQEHFAAKVDCSLVTIHNTLKRLGWRYKKNRYEPVNNSDKT